MFSLQQDLFNMGHWVGRKEFSIFVDTVDEAITKACDFVEHQVSDFGRYSLVEVMLGSGNRVRHATVYFDTVINEVTYAKHINH